MVDVLNEAFVDEINSKEREILTGRIYWTYLKTAYIGKSIQVGKRPVVVVSNNLNNKYCSTVNVLPITSQDKKPLPNHVHIEGCGLEKGSVILTEQITTIPKDTLEGYIGTCTSEIFRMVEKAMQIQKGKVEPFDITRVQRLIKSIILANKLGDDGQLLRSTLVCEFKWYCESYGYDYKVIFSKYKNNLSNSIVRQRSKLSIVC
jgi:mRNA interferase MazF